MKDLEEQFIGAWKKYAKMGRMSLDVNIAGYVVPLAHKSTKTIVYLGYEDAEEDREAEALFQLKGWTIIELPSTVGPLEAVHSVKQHIQAKQPKVRVGIRLRL